MIAAHTCSADERRERNPPRRPTRCASPPRATAPSKSATTSGTTVMRMALTQIAPIGSSSATPRLSNGFSALRDADADDETTDERDGYAADASRPVRSRPTAAVVSRAQRSVLIRSVRVGPTPASPGRASRATRSRGRLPSRAEGDSADADHCRIGTRAIPRRAWGQPTCSGRHPTPPIRDRRHP